MSVWDVLWPFARTGLLYGKVEKENRGEEKVIVRIGAQKPLFSERVGLLLLETLSLLPFREDGIKTVQTRICIVGFDLDAKAL